MFRLKPYPLIRRPPFAPWVPSRFRTRVQAFNRRHRRRYLQALFGARDFPIIACNCWGAGIYQDLERPFSSPFIGLFLYPACFLDFIAHYDQARLAPLEFIDQSRYNSAAKYPIGLLLDRIEVHFVHYPSCEDARDKWERRRLRLPEDPNDAYFMLGVGTETLEQRRGFAALPLRSKVLFSAQPTPGFTDEVVVRPWRGQGMMEGPQLYDECHAHFDIARWLQREA